VGIAPEGRDFLRPCSGEPDTPARQERELYRLENQGSQPIGQRSAQAFTIDIAEALIGPPRVSEINEAIRRRTDKADSKGLEDYGPSATHYRVTTIRTLIPSQMAGTWKFVHRRCWTLYPSDLNEIRSK
jgi:hypothetical protein